MVPQHFLKLEVSVNHSRWVLWGLHLSGPYRVTSTLATPLTLIESSAVFGRPFVKRFALGYWSVVCLSVCLSCPVLCDCLSVCLSVTLVYCGQTVGQIKTKLGMEWRYASAQATLC